MSMNLEFETPEPAHWEAGFARVDITPKEPMLLTGYSGNDRIWTTCSQRIYVRALACRVSDGDSHLILGIDLCGLDQRFIEKIEATALLRHGLTPDRLIINSSHNHSAPTVRGVLDLYYEHTGELDAQVAAYTERLEKAVTEVIALALIDLAPAHLAFSQYLCGFGANRRRFQPGRKHLPGPVDHDVPVLRITGENGSLRGVLFGYACHTTTLRGTDLNGDYAGWACRELEDAYANCTAIFLMGCGGDINPLPRYEMALSRACGTLLAGAVRQALDGPMCEISPDLSSASEPIHLNITEPPPLQDVQHALLETIEPYQQRALALQIRLRSGGDHGPKSVPMRIRCWRFGTELTLFTLSGEIVVDYSLKIKKQYGEETTWVAGYCDHLTPYIPSERVLEEGGYEGTESMLEYGYSSPFQSGLEDQIIQAALRCHDDASRTGPSAPVFHPTHLNLITHT
ncbi:hypothetical protein BH09VER1_BH09VER1_51910 [soil metagenome]